jgi:hypothetical protein
MTLSKGIEHNPDRNSDETVSNLGQDPIEIKEIVEKEDLGNGRWKIIGKTVAGIVLTFMFNTADLQAQCGIDGIQSEIAVDSSMPISNT